MIRLMYCAKFKVVTVYLSTLNGNKSYIRVNLNINYNYEAKSQ